MSSDVVRKGISDMASKKITKKDLKLPFDELVDKYGENIVQDYLVKEFFNMLGQEFLK